MKKKKKKKKNNRDKKKNKNNKKKYKLFEPEEHVEQSAWSTTPGTDCSKQIHSKERSPAEDEASDNHTDSLRGFCLAVQ